MQKKCACRLTINTAVRIDLSGGTSPLSRLGFWVAMCWKYHDSR